MEQLANPRHYAHARHGQENQILVVRLQPGQAIHTENGAMAYMDNAITMRTGAGKGRGIKGAVRRKMTGEDLLINIFTNHGHRDAHLGIAPPQPSHILPVAVSPVLPDIICHRHSYLAGHPDVRVSLVVNSAKTMFIGGASLTMQRLRGEGQAFIAANGAISQHYLAETDTFRAEAEAIAAFQDTVDYSVNMTKGLGNVLFGGERLFMLTLTGPGCVWFQSSAHFKIAAGHIKQLLRKEPQLLQAKK